MRIRDIVKPYRSGFLARVALLRTVGFPSDLVGAGLPYKN
jgi:hypothetical protein